MKFIIRKNKLLQSINHVRNAISSRAAIPILTGIKLVMNEEGLTLTGSDSNISIESFIPVEEDGVVNIEEYTEGSIVLQANLFPEIVRKLPEKLVELETDNHLNVTIRSGNVKYNLNAQDAEEYPNLPEMQAEENFTIESNVLKTLIKQTVFATSVMETRPILTGVNMEYRNEKLSFTATDSHRLALKEIPMEEIDLESIVIPGKSLNELDKIIENTDDLIQVNVTSNLILFRMKNLKFLSRLLDGSYPETSRLIPQDGKTRLVIQTNEFIQMIDRASLLVSEKQNNVVRLQTKNQNQIKITSQSPEIGEVKEVLTIDAVEGEELNISFSAKYMLDALRAVEADEVTITFTGAMRPFVIRPIEDASITQLITPVRTF